MASSLKPLIILIVASSVMHFFGCNAEYIPSSLTKNTDFRELVGVAIANDTTPAVRYAALEPIISLSHQEEELDWLASLIGRIVEANPHDPYGAYYMMALAEGSKKQNAEKLALHYLIRLLKSYPDLEIEGKSLHLLALGEIAIHTDNPYEAIMAREEMEERFSDRIASGRNQYFLAEEYRKVGDWDNMYQALKKVTQYPDVEIPGYPNALSAVNEALAFHASDKSWTMKNLEELVSTVKYAIRTQNASLLHRYQSEQFFLMNWSQETSDDFTHIPMTLGSFLNPNITFRRNLEDFSTSYEAFLWTSDWSWKIRTWYLYFRRVDYPANPEIHGRWEWAGIYFGERL